MYTLSKKTSYSHRPVDRKYIYTTVQERLLQLSETQPDRNAFVIFNCVGERCTVTCKELYRRSKMFAHGLMKLGIKPGDVIGIIMPNSLDYLYCSFGSQIAGAVPLYVPVHQVDGTNILAILQKVSDVKAIVVDTDSNEDKWKMCREFIDDINEDGTVVSQALPCFQYVVCTKPVTDYNVTTLGEIFQNGEVDVDIPQVDPEDWAVIFMSSGSTGTSKPIPYTHQFLLYQDYLQSNVLDLKADDIYFNPIPFQWSVNSPSLFLNVGMTTVTLYSDSYAYSFASVSEFSKIAFDVIQKENVTKMYFPVNQLLGMKGMDIKLNSFRVKRAWTTGMPMSSVCSELVRNLFFEELQVVYGTTETGEIAAKKITNVGQYKDFDNGNILPGIEIKVVDYQGRCVPRDTQGEIYIRTSIPMSTYINDMENTFKSFTKNGWYRTGDLGFMNQYDNIFVVGRNGDMMNIGGKRVHPSFIESKIIRVPGVQEVVVVPLPDPIMQQSACACILPKDGSKLDLQEVESYIKNNDNTKSEILKNMPQFCLLFDKFPRKSTGKPDKKILIEMAQKRLESHINSN